MASKIDPRVCELMRRRESDPRRLPMPPEIPGPSPSEVSEIESAKAAILAERDGRILRGRHQDLRTNHKTPNEETPAVSLAVEGKICGTCGNPCHPSNGRCYACRPGGPSGKIREPRTPSPRREPPPATKPQPAPAAGLDPSQVRQVVALALTLERSDPTVVRAVIAEWEARQI